MSLEVISTGEPPRWAVAAVNSVRADLAREEGLKDLPLKIQSWLEDDSKVWVSTSLTEDGEDLTVVHSLFMAEASVGSVYLKDGIYVIEILF